MYLERWRIGELPKYLCGLLYIIYLRSRCVRVLSRVLHNFRLSFWFAFGYSSVEWSNLRASIIWDTRSLLCCHRYGYLYLDVELKSIRQFSISRFGNASAVYTLPQLWQIGLYSLQCSHLLFYRLDDYYWNMDWIWLVNFIKRRPCWILCL